MVAELTDQTFEQNVFNNNKLNVVDFWAEWCGPCHAVSRIIEDLSNDYSREVKMAKVDVGVNPNLAVEYGITSMPSILFIKDGKVLEKHVGAVPKQVLEKKILAHLYK